MKKKMTEAVWRIVAAELDAGNTFKKVLAELRADGFAVSMATLERYRARDRKKLRAGETPPALERLQAKARQRQAPPPEAPTLDESAELVTLLRSLLTDSRERAARARSLGDAQTASREAKVCADLTNQLARAERNRAASRDVMTFSRADIEAGMRNARDKFAALQQRTALQGGLMCNGCGRDLIAAVMGVDLTPPPKEPS